MDSKLEMWCNVTHKLQWGELKSILGLESFKYLHHEISDGPDHFMVVVVERHLNVQTHELRQVAMRVGILRTKHCKLTHNHNVMF